MIKCKKTPRKIWNSGGEEETRIDSQEGGKKPGDHEPAAVLHEYGISVTVMNPLFIKQSGGGTIRKVKTDKADAPKIAQYRLGN